jgi:2-octaprenylphenol hydroxylase
MSKQSDYDVVIVGAGIAGLALVCGLIDKGLRIAILDSNPKALTIQPDREIGDCTSDLRVSAITLGSQQLLEQLQVWQKLTKTALSPFQGMEIWEETSASHLFFNAADTGQPHLGTIIKNSDLQTTLIAQAKHTHDIDWFAAESVAAIQNQNTLTLLSLTSGASISTRLLVGADGAQSCVRQLAGIQNKVWDYQQRAIIATVQTALAHEQIARQIFLATGPLAFLPLADPRLSSIVWSTTKELNTLSDELFCLELASAFEHRLGSITWTSPRLSFPLKAQQCEQYIKPGIALIGDAAHVIHPLAGQGANLGIADAVCLAKTILEALEKQRAIGAVYTLRRYERERRFHNRLMSGGINLIKHLFASSNPILKGTRNFGLRSVDKIAWLKNQFAYYGMGKPGITPFNPSF